MGDYVSPSFRDSLTSRLVAETASSSQTSPWARAISVIYQAFRPMPFGIINPLVTEDFPQAFAREAFNTPCTKEFYSIYDLKFIVKAYRIGIDDIDTTEGYCTTYLATLIIEEILKSGSNLLDFPYIVRLNPNIPYKTRGNAAVAIEFKGDEKLLDSIVKIFKENAVLEDRQRYGKPEPAMVIAELSVKDKLKGFYEECLVREVDLKEAEEIIAENQLKVILAKKERKKGLIGAIAAIGAHFEEFTYELLAYRKEAWNARFIDKEKVMEMDEIFKTKTFHNFDYEKKRVLITPHGRDPVLLGIRGYDPDILIEAFKFLEVEADRFAIFKTNQGTDAHLKIAEKKKYYSLYSVFNEEVVIEDEPEIIRGGHVVIEASNRETPLLILVYKESGFMNEKARALSKGDVIKVGGGISAILGNKLKINAERIEIIELAEKFESLRPPCPSCGSTLESAGDAKGLRCENCDYKMPFSFYLLIKKERELKEGEVILPPPRSRRHLTKPIEKENRAIEKPFSKKYFFSKSLFEQKTVIDFP